MATIDFHKLDNPNGADPIPTYLVDGSGVAFFASTVGSSVQINAYQDTSYASNGDGTQTGDWLPNTKYVDNAYPSGVVEFSASPGSPYSNGISGVKTSYATLGIEFGHTSAVQAQNVQLRIYDRNNIDYPASGVNTKVAEIVNWSGDAASTSYDTYGTDDGLGARGVGSGDGAWWGEPWPADVTNGWCRDQAYYKNSVGVTFYNALDTDSVVNGDTRLTGITGGDETVGGTGLVVPLLDSPGSGQKGLRASEVVSGTGMVKCKWMQYINDGTATPSTPNGQWGFDTDLNTPIDGHDEVAVGGLKPIAQTWGGTGVDTHHTWAVALSASPLSVGGKENYGLYVSLEYL